MTMISAVAGQVLDAYPQLVQGLQVQFECADVHALADRIVEAEAVDYYWEGRVEERYLANYPSFELDEDDDLADERCRIACLSRFADCWHVATFVVNGEGQALDLLWRRSFDDREEADRLFQSAR